MIVGENGLVEEVSLLRSSSYVRLDRAAMDIGRRYVFKPVIINNIPTRFATTLLIKFNLNTDESSVKSKFEQNQSTIGG
jgi:protein TonB